MNNKSQANLQIVVAFLLGEGPLDGVHYSDRHPIEAGKYWWRKHLRAALPASPTTEQSSAVDKESLTAAQAQAGATAGPQDSSITIDFKQATAPQPPAARPGEQDALGEFIACFNAAFAEGLNEALAETSDERLKDLIERRLMVGYWQAVGPSLKQGASS